MTPSKRIAAISQRLAKPKRQPMTSVERRDKHRAKLKTDRRAIQKAERTPGPYAVAHFKAILARALLCPWSPPEQESIHLFRTLLARAEDDSRGRP